MSYLVDSNGKYLTDANGKRLVSAAVIEHDCLVWIGNDFDSVNTLVRMWPDGTEYIPGPIAAGSRLTGMAVVGTELWVISGTSLTRVTSNGALLAPIGIPNAAGDPQAIIDTGSEVWISNYDLSRAIARYDYTATLIGTFNDSTLDGQQGSMAIVGDQIWCTNWGFFSGGTTISRLNLDGSSAGAAISGNGLSGPWGLAVVGASVWVGQRFTISRFLFDGTPDPAGNIDIGYYATGIAVVGAEVWVLDDYAKIIYRYDFSGSELGTLTPATVTEPVAIVYPFCITA